MNDKKSPAILALDECEKELDLQQVQLKEKRDKLKELASLFVDQDWTDLIADLI